MAEISELTLKQFTNELASNSPTPGGGAATALVLSISSALSSMVFNLTIGKKIYNSYNDEIKSKINEELMSAQKLKEDFLSFAQKDAEAFSNVMNAYHMPKSTDEENKLRNEAIEKSYIGAMNVPLGTARAAVRIYDCCETAARYGNKTAVSDAGVSCILASAAIESAILNVKINLKYIKDENIIEDVSKECDEILKTSFEMKAEIMELVNFKL